MLFLVVVLRWYATDDLSNTDEMRPYIEPAKRLVLDWAANETSCERKSCEISIELKKLYVVYCST